MRSLLVVVISILVISCGKTNDTSHSHSKIKYRGVSLVAPPQPFDPVYFDSLKEMGVSHVAIIPFGFSRNGHTKVVFNHSRQWWGEKDEGVIQTIKQAHDKNLEVLLKPHIWVPGEGWPGDFKLDIDSVDQWFSNYTDYIRNYARVADSLNVELFSIGNEFRHLTKMYPEKWKTLISDIRTIYKGKILYSANWDNYSDIQFWDEVDIVGINAYFPLPVKNDDSLNIESLKNAWDPWLQELKSFENDIKKPIIFTEYGYMSKTNSHKGHWSVENESYNEENQALAYDALLSVFRNEEWWYGGFSWKYFMKTIPSQEFHQRDAFIFQGKKAEDIIKKHYNSGY
ncbi:glycoside hydrolase family 113 [Marinigracilibium pacificum]|uniref:Glycoside hydrolase n=1 Tax=Marinigracilibium pacificum TaxID=2729599 RepID=A0A848JAC1_9BACT|nr:hypothetical protein [Marinigracilibium pacificum]NMM49992.1 hypothetical protein [Marinigracilibium pacificum]